MYVDKSDSRPTKQQSSGLVIVYDAKTDYFCNSITGMILIKTVFQHFLT